jgi:hypothetical protein
MYIIHPSQSALIVFPATGVACWRYFKVGIPLTHVNLFYLKHVCLLALYFRMGI